jgi:hypothetical protein
MRRRYLFGAITLSLAGAVAALTLSATAGAKSARVAIACAHPTKITPTHGGPGTRVTVYTKNADLVTSMWMRRKNDVFDPANHRLFDAFMDGYQHGDGWVSAKVPAGVTPRIIDGPIELDVFDGTDVCAVITDQIFKIEGYK